MQVVGLLKHTSKEEEDIEFLQQNTRVGKNQSLGKEVEKNQRKSLGKGYRKRTLAYLDGLQKNGLMCVNYLR
jgi:hypothetical protein